MALDLSDAHSASVAAKGHLVVLVVDFGQGGTSRMAARAAKSNIFRIWVLEIQLLQELPMDYAASLLLAALGAACIYAGYKLFCDLPVMGGPGLRATHAAVLLLNMVPGGLLALCGAALVTTQARGVLAHRPAIHSNAPPAEGTSWHPKGATAFDHQA